MKLSKLFKFPKSHGRGHTVPARLPDAKPGRIIEIPGASGKSSFQTLEYRPGKPDLRGEFGPRMTPLGRG